MTAPEWYCKAESPPGVRVVRAGRLSGSRGVLVVVVVVVQP